MGPRVDRRGVGREDGAGRRRAIYEGETRAPQTQ